MWFITSIATCRDSIENPSLNIKTQRTFGFFEHRRRAETAITLNTGNMEECLYNYLVLEYMEEGIHPEVMVEKWWSWGDETRRWEPCEKPSGFEGLVNWALG
jgi:hypothetical protein